MLYFDVFEWGRGLKRDKSDLCDKLFIKCYIGIVCILSSIYQFILLSFRVIVGYKVKVEVGFLISILYWEGSMDQQKEYRMQLENLDLKFSFVIYYLLVVGFW